MRDMAERAAWTFVQGALGAVTSVPLVTDVAGWRALAVAGATGGIGATISLVKTWAQERGAMPDTRVTAA